MSDILEQRLQSNRAASAGYAPSDSDAHARAIPVCAPRTGSATPGPAQGIDFYTTITRARFEELNMDLFRHCMEPVEKVLRVRTAFVFLCKR